jgi:hypothetical protein
VEVVVVPRHCWLAAQAVLVVLLLAVEVVPLL